MTQPQGTTRRAIVDAHRHPSGPRLAVKMAGAGLYQPKQKFPQANNTDLICYPEFVDLDDTMPVIPTAAGRQLAVSETRDRVFRLGLAKTSFIPAVAA